MASLPFMQDNGYHAKIAFLQGRAEAGYAQAIELAALSQHFLVAGDPRRAWMLADQAFRMDALDPDVERCILHLAQILPLSDVGAHLNLMLVYDERSDILSRLLRARFRSHDTQLTGRIVARTNEAELWIAARSDAMVGLRIVSDLESRLIELRPKADHPLASAFGFAASVSLPWGAHSFFDVQCETNKVVWIRNVAPRPGASAIPTGRVQQGAGSTVILPIYGGLAETQVCLDSLCKDACRIGLDKVILIDDASPESGINALLQKAAGLGARIVQNQINIGYTASANRGLALAPPGDVILLNSDTIVSPHWVDRLAAVAASDPLIGTVTPLSNNGESVSAPAAFERNPLPTYEDICKISERLWSVVGPKSTDLPSGIGFCLFVKTNARQVAGCFDEENFGRGYLEEVDFCLRLKAKGFRNVCAEGVYIGHHGETSFGLEKAYLVARHMRVLRKLYPEHEVAYQRFAAMDPLLEVRNLCRPLTL